MKLQRRADVPVELTWDLSLIYKTEEDMYQDVEAVKALAARIEEEYKGSIRRVPTEKSKEIGIITRQGMGTFGAYTIILYSEQAQRFIIDHLTDIVKYYDANSEK